jgi:hypothetical protein
MTWIVVLGGIEYHELLREIKPSGRDFQSMIHRLSEDYRLADVGAAVEAEINEFFAEARKAELERAGHLTGEQ